jgi:cytoskeletal protein CcmA (bactofilin family)
MFNSNSTETPNKTPAVDRKRSVIAEDIVIEGNIISQGILEFGGQIIGDVTAEAVVLTPTARVRGRVRARQLTIEGELQGAATALNVSIKNGAQVKANFAYETLEVASGAQVDGEYKRISAEVVSREWWKFSCAVLRAV